ncbi:MAG: REP-associated tyrosine transposase [Opitutales bacterium]
MKLDPAVRANTEIRDPGTAALPSCSASESAVRANTEIRDPGTAALPSCSRGWNSRGYIPHFDSGTHIQHVTVHLADSLPKSVIKRIDERIEAMPDEERAVERRIRLNEWIDAGHGACHLRETACAEIVENAFLHFDGLRYRLLAWCVMPNHFHVLFQPLSDWSMAKIVASWKKFTATEIQKWLRANTEIRDPGTTAKSPLWHPEYWDRYIRNEKHFDDVVDYIHMNPVKAGFCRKPADWKWSSAYA